MAPLSKDPATLATQGKKAMDESKYDEALTLYTAAIDIRPNSPLFYLQRSICHQRLQKGQEAVDDAEIALYLAEKLGKRDLKAQAQLRRGIGYFFLHRLGDALQCLKWSKKLDEKEKSLNLWFPKVEVGLSKLEEGDERANATVPELPDVSDKIAAEKPSTPAPVSNASPAASTAVKQATGVTTPVDKIREEMIQNNTHVTWTLYVKGVPKDKASVIMEPRSFHISFPLANGSEYSIDKDPLFAEIDVDNSRSSVLSTKIELHMKKKVEGKKWLAMEAKEEDVKAEQASAPVNKPAAAPSYPTSSRTGPKNWDTIVTDVNDDEEEGDPVNSLFKTIFKNADDDTKRAMMKSYVESQGTALSTNWEEVGKKKMEVTPPEGMEAKPYEM